jgi:hypothetical protein
LGGGKVLAAPGGLPQPPQPTATTTTTTTTTPAPTTSPIDTDLVNKILEDNAKLHNVLRDLMPHIGNKVVNNQFNLNVFLNEDCKNAINMSEFVSSIQIELSDMDYTRQNSLECGIRNIIQKALAGMDVNERPIHCTDSKRRTLYVKENNRWERDTRDTNHQLVKDGIGLVQQKQIYHIRDWATANPTYTESGRIQDDFVRLARVCTDKLTDAQTSRIIGAVANDTVVGNSKEGNRLG